jgi:hypothetical protein
VDVALVDDGCRSTLHATGTAASSRLQLAGVELAAGDHRTVEHVSGLKSAATASATPAASTTPSQHGQGMITVSDVGIQRLRLTRPMPDPSPAGLAVARTHRSAG